MSDYLRELPVSVRLPIANAAAAIIERADALGGRWGATPYVDGIRVNVGWTEILTAYPTFVSLTVDRDLAGNIAPEKSLDFYSGDDPRGFYPSVPGSMLAELTYRPRRAFQDYLDRLLPAVLKAAELAHRRGAGRGVQEGHRQGVVSELSALVGRALPSPQFARDNKLPISAGSTLMEGALQRMMSSRYERNANARDACLAHHGTACLACGFSFESVYGPLGASFIHVHHHTPISHGPREIDPIKDLAPVCPNCHAMLHREDPPLSIQSLRNLILRPAEA